MSLFDIIKYGAGQDPNCIYGATFERGLPIAVSRRWRGKSRVIDDRCITSHCSY